MRVVKPGWVNHDGKPIFSVDIHPDGSRFATGGQGSDYGKIIIWNMAPVRDAALEEDEKVPKILCQMENHYACVNCVRWSYSGKFLASGGDDKLVMIWQTSRGAGPSKSFGSTGSVTIFEQWRPVWTLRGHSGDVLDVSWSPEDVWLATCSVDNTVIIWNALNFPEQLATLKGHSGLVKGVTWDPVGKYLASQSDDRSVRVWRTMDWQQESVVTEPFKECGGTTHSLRLNWSPDGQHIVSAHAMNNSGPSAYIIERQGFKATLDFVGHRKAITVVRFNPNIFRKVQKNEKVLNYSCCAIGSKDRSVSIWLTCLKRPLVVMHDLFENSIVDLSWSANGQELMSCSIDGTIGFLDFTAMEIGSVLSKDEVKQLLENLYGKSISLNAAATKGNQIIESAAMLKLQEQHKGMQNNLSLMTPTKSNSKHSNHTNSSMDGSPFKPMDKQIETRTADGRRRITPIFLAPQPEVGEVPLPFSTNPEIEFHSSSERSKIVVEKQNRVTVPGMLSPSSGSKSMPSPPILSPTAREILSTSSRQAQLNKAANETTPEKQTSKSQDKVTVSSVSSQEKAKPPLQSQDKAKLQPPIGQEKGSPITDQKAMLADRFDKPSSQLPEKQKSSEKDKEKSDSGGKDVVKDKEKVKAKLSASLTLKRKLADDKRYGKRGRPSKLDQAAREAAMAPAAAEMIKDTGRSEPSTPMASSTPRPGAVLSTRDSRLLLATPDLRLSPLSIEKAVSKVLQGQPGDVNSLALEVENSIEMGTTRVHRLRCLKGGRTAWEHVLTSAICAIDGSSHIVCAACKDGTVSVYSPSGRRLLPKLVCGAAASVLTCTGHYVLLITVTGSLFVWNCQSFKAEIKNESLTSIMSDKDSLEQATLTTTGVPVVTLTNKKSYSFSLDIGCWILVTDTEDRLQALSNHQNCVPTKLRPLGPLSTLQKQARSSEQASRTFQSQANARQSVTLSHLESQVASCLALKSGNEYKFWVETYIRYLAQEGLEEKLREVCDELLGPVYRSRSKNHWSQHILGVDKHAVLRNVLPAIGTDLRFQRLYTEYKDQLDVLSEK